MGSAIRNILPRLDVATRVRSFNSLWVSSSIDELYYDLRSAAHRHIAIVVGSAASYGHPSACLSVGAVRATVLSSLQATIQTDSHAGELVHALLHELKGDADARDERLSKEVSLLPFEQFLGCLSATSEDSAAAIVRNVCGTNTPNENHDSIVAIAAALLEHRAADTVSIITTNYDLCLDGALRAALGDDALQTVSSLSFPCYEARLSNGARLSYLKVHGCISKPATLIFNFAQMMRLLLSSGWAQETSSWLCGEPLVRPSLAMFVGYGFWDPDLRGWMQSLFDGAHLYRNEIDSFKEHDPSSATEYLQREFFDELCTSGCSLRLLRSSLVDQDVDERPQSNVLTTLRRRFTGEDVAVPGPPPARHGDTESPLAHWNVADATHFLSRLLYACNRADGTQLFKSQLDERRGRSRQVDLAHAYLRTFGNANDWTGGAAAARELRRMRLSRDVDVIAYGYESFMHTLRNDIHILKRGLRGGLCLAIGIVLCEFADKRARAVFQEYSVHYWVKTIEALWQLSGRFTATANAYSIMQRVARAYSPRMRARLKQLADAKDLDVYGDATALIAELAILSGERSHAIEAAKQARVFRSVIGRASNAIQGERLLGWAQLVGHTEHARTAATSAFARGMSLAMQLPEEPGLARKMGANLLRIRRLSTSSGFRVTARQHSAETMQGACSVLYADHGSVQPDEDVDAAWRIIEEHVLSLFAPNEAKLMDEFKRYADPARYPIYLPFCEPDD